MRHLMIAWMLSLAGCATTNTDQTSLSLPTLPEPEPRALATIPSESQLFTLPDAALNYIDKQVAAHDQSDKARLQALSRWLTSNSGLNPVYDSSYTRTAAETLQTRAGNCLSLAMLSGIVAQRLGLTPIYRQPDLPYIWDQSGNIELVTHHVNLLVLPPRQSDRTVAYGGDDFLLIDFINNPGLQRIKSNALSRAEMADLFYANRAGELLTEGDIETAYAYIYTAITRSPELLPAYPTLGVLLRRKGQPELAEQIYRAGLDKQPENPNLLNNLMVLYEKQQQPDKAETIRQQLAQLDRSNPFHLARRAEAAYQAEEYQRAKALYQQALDKADYIHSFHFGLAKVHWQLGEAQQARQHLQQAQLKALNSESRQRYSLKLAHLNES